MLESAGLVSGFDLYQCPCCKADVNYRSGSRNKPHFAHWPGSGSPECENFCPDHHESQLGDQAPVSNVMWRMELRLQISEKRDRFGWSLELVIPPSRKCHAEVTIDVGGRMQTLDMRGMEKPRRVSVELSDEPYRIISFSGDPDPEYVAMIERECPGLPSYGAAVFDVSLKSALSDFPRAKELRESEKFAMLWREPTNPDFHEELLVDRFYDRRGWNLALITLPDSPSKECADWLWSFTQLSIAPTKPSTIPVWPFLTKIKNLTEIESIKTDTVLVSAVAMPVENWHLGPDMEVSSSSAVISGIGLERSPAFFLLKPEGTDGVKISAVGHPELCRFLSFPLQHVVPQDYPAVEISFITAEGSHYKVPLHQAKSSEVATEARINGMRAEYLSMPPGVKGHLLIDGPGGRSEEVLLSGDDAPPHNQCMRLLKPNMLTKLASALADPVCYVAIDFGGFGRLCLAASRALPSLDLERGRLSPALRSRLLSFLFQLQLAASIDFTLSDIVLVEALEKIQPEPKLIPHYRSLVREVLASGFKFKNRGEGVLS